MARQTLLDVAKLNGNDTVVGLIEENLVFVPELQYFPMRQISGTSYTTVKRTGRPSVSFRSANQGVTPSKSTFAQSLVQCYILSARVEVDKAILDAQSSEDASLEVLESNGVMKQAMIEIANQIWYGVTTDDKGFPGVKASTPVGGATTLNSGGTNSNVQSSLYAVRFGVQDVTLIAGRGTPFSLSEFRDESCEDSNGAKFPGRVADLCGWVGLQIGNVNCVGRIANIGDDGETGDKLTDTKISQLLNLYPVGYEPTMLFTNKRSRAQLQQSRTVVINSGPGNAKAGSGLESIAPIPTEAFGIPLHVSEAILATDAAE